MGTVNWHQLEFGYLLKQFSLYLFRVQHKNSGIFSYSVFLSPTFLISVVSVIVSFLLLRWFYLFKKSLTEKSIILELTPPAFTDKSAYTTGQLFSVIHGLGKYREVWEKLVGTKPKISFEIVSTKDQGIRYLVRTTPYYAGNFKRYILSYLPQVRVKETSDYLTSSSQEPKTGHQRIIEFKLSRHFAYPLKKQDILGEHDPVAYITGMMTKLLPARIGVKLYFIRDFLNQRAHHTKYLLF